MKYLLHLLLLLGLAACASEQVQYANPQANVDFRAYKTFNFMDVTARNDAAFEGPGTGIETLKQAIGREMTRRGYQQSDTPDLLVNIGVVTQDKVQTRETTLLQDAPRYIGQRNYHWRSQQVPVGRYEEGTATVEVVDAARKEVVWEGSVKSVLTRDAAKLTKRINEAITALFAKYPVEPGQ
ncbi:MAG TPA: DUF4136 domain-containing protein [Hymenobacter sp.]|jgi:hypothetical protein|uniref:DUF4136 domain-containing protein n=1 Tax=Hymenobacter sp. TaxID=1898978 RepID=UPI002ED93A38